MSLIAAGIAVLLPLPAQAWVRRADEGVELYAAAADRKGNVAVAGTLRGTGGESSLYVARYSSGGKLLWRAVEPGGTLETPAQARAAAVDSRGDVYVAGQAPGGAAKAQFFVARYAAVTGSRVWVTVAAPELPDGITTSGSAATLALDRYGHVLAGGRVQGTSAGASLLAQLDAATGAVRWQWTGPVGEVRSLAAAGRDVVATGPVPAVRLSGSTGAEQWRLDRSGTGKGPPGFPLMRTIAVTRTGDVVVGGSLRNTLEDFRAFYVARLAGFTGALRWEYAGPPSDLLETPARVAVDSSGDVYAGGRLNRRPASVRLRSATGAARWVRQPWADDPRGGTTLTVTDVAVDSRNVYVTGSEGANRFVATAFTRNGARRWGRDLGDGRVTAEALSAGDRLFLVGRVSTGPGGPQDGVIVGLRASTGAHLGPAGR